MIELWSSTTVKDFSKLTAGGTPSTKNPEYWEGGAIPWLSSGEVHKKRIRFSDGFISEQGMKNSAAKLIPIKTLLVALAGQGKTRGTVAITEIETTTNQSIAGIIADEKVCLPDFLFFNLDSRYNELRSLSGGSGRAGLNLKILGDVDVLLPSLPEQKKIATILTSMDDVIENTQARIAKLQDLKKATMNELLTRGIGHTAFKDSELGRIPKSWEIESIGALAKKVGSGNTPKGGASVYQNRGIIFIRSQNIHFGGLRLDDVAYISEQIHGGMKGSNVLGGDVLLNITGASIGRCALVPDDFWAANVNQHVCIIRPREQLYNAFLTDWLSSDFGQNQIMLFQAGGNREGLNFQQIRSMELPLPSLAEQKEICKIIGTFQAALNETNSKLRQMRFLKKALMNDLLTGKVRVNVN